jgi:hypothetical protein
MQQASVSLPEGNKKEFFCTLIVPICNLGPYLTCSRKGKKSGTEQKMIPGLAEWLK